MCRCVHLLALRCGAQPFLMIWRPRQPSYTSDKFMLYAVGGKYFGVSNDNWSGLDLKAGASPGRG